MEPVVRAINLTRRFGKLTAVDRISIEIPPGEIFGLVGPDGAGKTTTLRLLCGLLDPTEGEAWVVGHNVARDLNAAKDQIGYMAQRFGLYGDLTVEENMNFYADLFGIGKSDHEKLSRELLAMTRMEPFRNRPAAKLSGGMKQKLALMCTLLHRPRVLFLDEPTNGVDPVSRRDFWAILYQLVRDGLTLFVTTAYLDEAERCNRVALMDRGRLIRVDSPVKLKAESGGEWYRLQSPDRVRAREFLQTQHGVVSVEPAGAALHLLLEDATPPAIESAMKTAGLSVASFERIEPSLEDVFIALIRKSEESRAAA
jgi:ABC-2 type transport system ATP-binding protein